MDSSENKLIVKSITNLLKVKHRYLEIIKMVIFISYKRSKFEFKVVEESNLFNPTTDQFNGGIFKSFLKSFLKKSFVCEFE
jgi:hypothetical protein